MAITFVDDVEETKGYVIFSLTNGPEYHVLQVKLSALILVFWIVTKSLVF